MDGDGAAVADPPRAGCIAEGNAQVVMMEVGASDSVGNKRIVSTTRPSCQDNGRARQVTCLASGMMAFSN